MKFVSRTCSRKEVSFRTPSAIDKLDQGINVKFDEWMMICRAKNMIDETDRDIEYLISTAYESNKVFVYSWNQLLDKIYLENVSTHVNINLEDM